MKQRSKSLNQTVIKFLYKKLNTHRIYISNYLHLYNEIPQNSETQMGKVVIHYFSGFLRSRVLEHLQQHVCPWTSDEVAVRQQLVLGYIAGFSVHMTSWEDSNHEGHPCLVLDGTSLWSLQHSHFRVVRFLTCYFGIAKTYVPRERINQAKPKFFKDPSLKLTQPHFCHFLLVKAFTKVHPDLSGGNLQLSS